MPITTTIDRWLGMIFTTAEPVITDRDWLQHQAALRDLPDFDPDFDQLLDFRPVADCRLSPQTLRLTALHPVFGACSRQAFVTDNNLTYGMCRMYEILSAGHSQRIEVFRDMRAAAEWLGLNRRCSLDAAAGRPMVKAGRPVIHRPRQKSRQSSE